MKIRVDNASEYYVLTVAGTKLSLATEHDGAKGKQQGAKYPTATARGCSKCKAGRVVMLVAALAELFERGFKVTDGSPEDGGHDGVE